MKFQIDGTSSPHPTTIDFDTSFDQAARKALHIQGLVPPAVEGFSKQERRCMEQINLKSTAIDKYSYLSNLRNTNAGLFYRLLIDHMKELTPYVYTPTVGEACLKWSHIYTNPEGLYLSYTDKGNLRDVIANWPQDMVEIAVVTDGSRILGLGDLGVNGMGIPVGKLALYVGCAGIHPERTLPITLDFGTNNEEFLKDDLYMGARHKRVPEEEQKEFLDEMMTALTDRWRNIVIQFEDFKSPFWSLERYRNTYTVFNDDIQGTGAVILGGLISAFKRSSTPLKDHKLVFMGAGSAATGVAEQICGLFIRNGIPEAEAKKMFWLVDSRGMVTMDRGDQLQEHKIYFARDDNDGLQLASLQEVVEYVQPTALIGLCTIGGVFTETIVRKMAELNSEPIIFPLSNPSVKSECTYEQAMKWTDNRVIFASGSPFPSVTVDGVERNPGQGNNMYVFPGIGLGTILCQAAHVTDSMIYASAAGLAASLNEEEIARGDLYPELRRVREVSVVVAREVIRAAQKEGVDRHKMLQFLSDKELDEFIVSRMYDPKIIELPSRSVSRGGSPSRENSPPGSRGRSQL
ncbi:hypothetical protein FN846DRAFT_773834 [Sphaerosporella brunnea]|uniref:Malic enzyme n=1 Tax=Sphaerosporella brunnea TaxID=1250544 RepID=A0A5J5F667_9PEZI|nr:hypothetical protein FN846DRAFT_773834 [Sphaerosporella brunnea]